MEETEEASVPEQPEESVKPESPENQEAAGDSTQEKAAGDAVVEGTEEAEKVSEPVSDQLEQGAEGGAEVSEPVPEIEQPGSEEIVGDSELEPGAESQVITGEETTTIEIPEDTELVEEVEDGKTVQEFIESIVDTIFSNAIDILEEKSADFEFVFGIVDKVVSHAVGEETPEESEESAESLKIMEIEQPGEEEISGEVIKYLQGPESLRFEEALWKPEIPLSCVSYMNVVEYARKFVDDILERARDICLLRYGVSVRYRKKPAEVQTIRWPSIESFTIDLGSRKIDEYIQMTFEVEENWLYKINFIAAQSDLSSDVYLYEAIFCIPTPCYPVAQATVSIYFNCDVSRVKPRECPIDVTYTIESLKEVMVPGKAVVNDDILLRLVYSKLSVFKSLYF